MKTLTLVIEASAVDELRASLPNKPSVQALLDACRKWHVTLRPVHPGSQDTGLKTFFEAELADDKNLEAVGEALRTCPGVLAVYAKPADEAP